MFLGYVHPINMFARRVEKHDGNRCITRCGIDWLKEEAFEVSG